MSNYASFKIFVPIVNGDSEKQLFTQIQKPFIIGGTARLNVKIAYLGFRTVR